MADPLATGTKPSLWMAIVGYWAIGVLAAAQLGKMSALAPLIAEDLGLSLTTVAAATSLLEIGGATLGLVAGVLAARLGLRRSLLVGVSCLTLASIGSGFAQGAPSLLAWRLIEAVGYLGIVVTAPVLITAAAMPSRVGVAMALWSTFVPVGLAIGAWAWAGVAGMQGWRSAMFFGALLASIAVVGCALSRASASPVAHRGANASVGPAVWMLSSSFGCYALFEVSLLALLPSYLTQQAGATVAQAGRWTALAALATIAGSAVAAWWMRRGGAQRVPVLIALLLPAALMFVVFAESPSVMRIGVAAIVLNAISGAYPSFAFAWLPEAAGDMHKLARANGVFTQFGASGSLLGPPLLAAIVEHHGWSAAPWVGVAATLPCAWLAMHTLRSIRMSPR